MVGRQVLIDNQIALLDVNASREQVGGHQNPTHALPERLHDHGPVVHLQVGMDDAHAEPVVAHLVRKQLGALFRVHLNYTQPNVDFLK